MAKLQKWKAIPLNHEIISMVLKNKGEILTADLYRQLVLKYKDLTKSELMEELFRLEVSSFIRLVLIKKDVTKVEINTKARLSDDLMEQFHKFVR